jgi:rSAM/selenodomain-associated transferase 1
MRSSGLTTVAVERALVVVFTRAPVVGRVKTRLARAVGDVAALECHRALLRSTLQAVETSGLDAELRVDGDPAALPPHRLPVHGQRGGDLGERMQDAIADVCARGRTAILIGTDCPVLDAGYLLAADAALRNGADVVIGPVEDGGYVLIGMTRPLPELFVDMPWSTPAVREQTLRRAAQSRLDVVVLEELWDVDGEGDYRRWQRLAATADRRPSKFSE